MILISVGIFRSAKGRKADVIQPDIKIAFFLSLVIGVAFLIEAAHQTDVAPFLQTHFFNSARNGVVAGNGEIDPPPVVLVIGIVDRYPDAEPAIRVSVAGCSNGNGGFFAIIRFCNNSIVDKHFNHFISSFHFDIRCLANVL